MTIESHISIRKCGVEGVDELWWVTADRGAFGSMNGGPLGDWISDHKRFMEYVRSFDTVIQAGGNCGMYARFYANYFKNVYTFEPCEINFTCLDRNCVGDSFHKYHGALGNRIDKVSLKLHKSSNVGMHKIDEKPGDIQMYRIDDLELSSCDLIHLDVEGYEGSVLDGAMKTIMKFKPVVILERGHGERILIDNGYVLKHKLKMDSVYVIN